MQNSLRKFCSAVVVASSGSWASLAAAETVASVRVAVPSNVRVEVGSALEVFVGIIPSKGFHVSADGPLKVSIGVPDGVRLGVKRTELRRRHASEPRSRAPSFPLTLQPEQGGSVAVEVTAHFWLCKAQLCRPTTSKGQFRVTTAVPGPPAQGD